MRIKSLLTHSLQAIAEGSLIALLVVGLMAGSVFAGGKGGGGGKPGGGGTTGGSYAATVSPAGPYTFGQDIYVTTNAPVYPNNTGPWVDVSCTQNGTTVYNVTHAGFAGGWYYNWAFTLGPTYMWAGGAADCKVRVYHQSNNKLVTDATTTFHVDG
jgi:hypothetical protein